MFISIPSLQFRHSDDRVDSGEREKWINHSRCMSDVPRFDCGFRGEKKRNDLAIARSRWRGEDSSPRARAFLVSSGQLQLIHHYLCYGHAIYIIIHRGIVLITSRLTFRRNLYENLEIYNRKLKKLFNDKALRAISMDVIRNFLTESQFLDQREKVWKKKILQLRAGPSWPSDTIEDPVASVFRESGKLIHSNSKITAKISIVSWHDFTRIHIAVHMMQRKFE